jgi:hypothetical protein
LDGSPQVCKNPKNFRKINNWNSRTVFSISEKKLSHTLPSVSLTESNKKRGGLGRNRGIGRNREDRGGPRRKGGTGRRNREKQAGPGVPGRTREDRAGTRGPRRNNEEQGGEGTGTTEETGRRGEERRGGGNFTSTCSGLSFLASSTILSIFSTVASKSKIKLMFT